MVTGFFIVFLFAAVGYMAFKFISKVVRGEVMADQLPAPVGESSEVTPEGSEAGDRPKE